MLKCFIVGNLTKDPDLRSTREGTAVCTFTVACNRRNKGAQAGQDADFVRVTVWRKLAENCRAYLTKGKKISAVGTMELGKYTDGNGNEHYYLDMTADDVEFLTPRNEATAAPAQKVDQQSGFVQVDADDELPF